jgi:hypothetical protein
VYVKEDGDFVVYDAARCRKADARDADELRELVDDDTYIEAMNAIGVTPVIDI